MSGLGNTIRKHGIDPISRKAGIEPDNWGRKVHDWTSGLSLTPDMPEMPDTSGATDPPGKSDAEVREAAAEERRRLTRRRGRASTMLTGAGDIGSTSTARARLLGG